MLKFISKAAGLMAPVAQKLAPAAAWTSAHASEIMLGGGVVLTLTGAGLGCKATLKAKDDLEEGLTRAEELKEAGAEQPEIGRAHVKTGLVLAKDYAVPVIVLTSGIALIVISHCKLRRELAVALAASDAWQLAFEEYRRRVVEDQGEEKDALYMHGDRKVKAEFHEVDPETGKDRKIKKEIIVRDGSIDPYMIPFNPWTCTEYPTGEGSYYKAIDMAEVASHFLTRKLLVKGRVFLWQAYEYFGHKYTPISGVAGWVLGGEGDDEVVVSVDEVYTQEELDLAKQENRSPKPELWLRFNCDGSILNVED